MKKISTLLLLMLISLSAFVAIHQNRTTTDLTKVSIIAATDDDDDVFLPPSTPANPLKAPGSNG